MRYGINIIESPPTLTFRVGRSGSVYLDRNSADCAVKAINNIGGKAEVFEYPEREDEDEVIPGSGSHVSGAMRCAIEGVMKVVEAEGGYSHGSTAFYWAMVGMVNTMRTVRH